MQILTILVQFCKLYSFLIIILTSEQSGEQNFKECFKTINGSFIDREGVFNPNRAGLLDVA